MTSIERGSRVGSHVCVIDWETRLPENGARSLRNLKRERRERFRIQECNALESDVGVLISSKESRCSRVSHQ